MSCVSLVLDWKRNSFHFCHDFRDWITWTSHVLCASLMQGRCVWSQVHMCKDRTIYCAQVQSFRCFIAKFRPIVPLKHSQTWAALWGFGTLFSIFRCQTPRCCCLVDRHDPCLSHNINYNRAVGPSLHPHTVTSAAAVVGRLYQWRMLWCTTLYFFNIPFSQIVRTYVVACDHDYWPSVKIQEENE